MVTGRIERGICKVGEEMEIVGFRPTRKTVVTGVEMFKKLLDQGMAGDNVGLLLRGVEKDEVERGQVIAKPGSITPHTKFRGEVYVLSKEEGGRHTPFFKGYRPQFYFRTTDVTGVAQLPEGTEMVMPGDNVNLTVELITPIAMDILGILPQDLVIDVLEQLDLHGVAGPVHRLDAVDDRPPHAADEVAVEEGDGGLQAAGQFGLPIVPGLEIHIAAGDAPAPLLEHVQILARRRLCTENASRSMGRPSSCSCSSQPNIRRA